MRWVRRLADDAAAGGAVLIDTELVCIAPANRTVRVRQLAANRVHPCRTISPD
ncbi:MAG: hypothetical protein JO115_18010 [Pseudonocardiales bacterium]|nr:hypothetical protein [Pseudonocardiales bacterium]